MKKIHKSRLTEIIFVLASLLCLCALLNLRWKQSLTISQMLERGQMRILEQQPVELELTIRLDTLPEELELDSHDKDWAIPVYETGTTTIYLKSISTSNESREQLYVGFTLKHHDMPERGEIVRICEMGPWNSDWENDPGYFSVDETVWDAEQSYADAASIRGYGPGEQVWYYLDTDVLEQARERITFRGTFLRVDYEKV